MSSRQITQGEHRGNWYPVKDGEDTDRMLEQEAERLYGLYYRIVRSERGLSWAELREDEQKDWVAVVKEYARGV